MGRYLTRWTIENAERHRLPHGRGSERISHAWRALPSRDREGAGAIPVFFTDPYATAI